MPGWNPAIFFGVLTAWQKIEGLSISLAILSNSYAGVVVVTDTTYNLF
ncbi:hypothetical protein ACU9SG_002687 [Serratia marcescens]|nr:hypothetical protein [Serratia marcescens]EME1466489.1 hypothetical protein [Serratia marcescens]MDP8622216.1 hypothetical protein [Serratia marcescens]HEJ7814864.1 hypothetical protein [Serratia marcescens]